MNTTNKFENLQAWQESHKLVIMVYKAVKLFPADEKFRLIDQICRSASSVAANLAEGSSRASRKEYLQFVYQSKGSLEETKYHLLLARDLGYLKPNEYEKLIEQATICSKLLNGLITYLRSNPADARPLRTKNKEL
jgi:four helix bundle protein